MASRIPKASPFAAAAAAITPPTPATEAEVRARGYTAELATTIAVIAAAHALAPPGPRTGYVYEVSPDKDAPGKAKLVPVVAKAGALFVRRDGSRYIFFHVRTGRTVSAPNSEVVKTKRRALELLELAARPKVGAALEGAIDAAAATEAVKRFYEAWLAPGEASRRATRTSARAVAPPAPEPANPYAAAAAALAPVAPQPRAASPFAAAAAAQPTSIATPPMKVWAWNNPERRDCPQTPNLAREAREIVAAPSKAAAHRAFAATGYKPGEVTETKNTAEIAAAMGASGVLWQPKRKGGQRFVLHGEPWAEIVGVPPVRDAEAEARARELLPEIASRVAGNQGYHNARLNTPQAAPMEYERVLSRVMLGYLREETNIYRRFVGDPTFKRWLSDAVEAMVASTFPVPSAPPAGAAAPVSKWVAIRAALKDKGPEGEAHLARLLDQPDPVTQRTMRWQAARAAMHHHRAELEAAGLTVGDALSLVMARWIADGEPTAKGLDLWLNQEAQRRARSASHRSPLEALAPVPATPASPGEPAEARLDRTLGAVLKEATRKAGQTAEELAAVLGVELDELAQVLAQSAAEGLLYKTRYGGYVATTKRERAAFMACQLPPAPSKWTAIRDALAYANRGPEAEAYVRQLLEEIQPATITALRLDAARAAMAHNRTMLEAAGLTIGSALATVMARWMGEGMPTPKEVDGWLAQAAPSTRRPPSIVELTIANLEDIEVGALELHVVRGERDVKSIERGDHEDPFPGALHGKTLVIHDAEGAGARLDAEISSVVDELEVTGRHALVGDEREHAEQMLAALQGVQRRLHAQMREAATPRMRALEEARVNLGFGVL